MKIQNMDTMTKIAMVFVVISFVGQISAFMMTGQSLHFLGGYE